MKIRTIIFTFWLLFACSESKISRADFMAGTWKMEGKEQYEVWEPAGNGELKGYSYKFQNNQKIISETLSIKIIDHHIVYEANVPDQNEGKSISFTLNDSIKEYLSFENIGHDFPKKIQYRRITKDEIEVSVLGEEGRGFSYRQLKQD
jgi:hypothetical protein